MFLLFAPGFKMNKDIKTFHVAQDAQEIGVTVRTSQNAQTAPTSDNVNQLPVNGQTAPQSSNVNQHPVNGQTAQQSSNVNQHPVNGQAAPQSSNVNQHPVTGQAAPQSSNVNQHPVNGQTAPQSSNVNQHPVNGQAAPLSSNVNQHPVNGQTAPLSSNVNQHPVNGQAAPQSSNVNQQKDNLPEFSDHMPVIQQGIAYVFGGYITRDDGLVLQSADEIWKYNLYTEEWNNEKAEGDKAAIHILNTRTLVGCCAVSIDKDIYVFGVTKDKMATLWKLRRDEKGSLSWVEVPVNESSSERYRMTGWEFEESLYIFGGYGLPPVDVSDLNGIFIPSQYFRVTSYGSNNQLLCFDPSCEEWSTKKSDGAVPSPRCHHSTTENDNTVWLYGGMSDYNGQHLNDLYQLNMETSTDAFTWTQIEIQPLPIMLGASMTAIASNKLAIHDYGKDLFSDNERAMTWILDLTTRSWREYASTTDHYRVCHASVTGLSDSVIIIGGDRGKKRRSHSSTCTFCIKLQPKSMEQLAARAVYEHHTTLPWKVLPEILICKVMGWTS